MPILAYMSEYEDKQEFSKKNLERMYITQKLSTPKISEQLGINKATLIRTIHYYGIRMRNISEATKNQLSRDGLWNKGKTKKDHPSIKRYADSRKGKNNPYYTAPGYEERRRKNKEHFKGIARNPSGSYFPKTTEVRMAKILGSQKIQYLPHFYVKYKKTWRIFDFLVEGRLIIEMQGNYYHANPRRYSANDLIVIYKKKRRAEDIWEYDEDKKQLALDLGYMYTAIWEDNFCDMTDVEVLPLIYKLLEVSYV